MWLKAQENQVSGPYDAKVEPNLTVCAPKFNLKTCLA